MKLILSTLCIALLALFAYQVMSYPLDVESVRGKSLDKELAKSIDYDLPQLAVLKSIDKYSEIVQRPLFVKGRAAAVNIRSVTKATTVDALAHLILVGTASSSDVQIAIVADTKAKQMERLKVGESYKEWNIAEVSSNHVIFQNEELEYKLFVTPIKGSQKEKQAKLIKQLNKSKIEKLAELIDYANMIGNKLTTTTPDINGIVGMLKQSPSYIEGFANNISRSAPSFYDIFKEAIEAIPGYIAVSVALVCKNDCSITANVNNSSNDPYVYCAPFQTEACGTNSDYMCPFSTNHQNLIQCQSIGLYKQLKVKIMSWLNTYVGSNGCIQRMLSYKYNKCLTVNLTQNGNDFIQMKANTSTTTGTDRWTINGSGTGTGTGTSTGTSTSWNPQTNQLVYNINRNIHDNLFS